MQILRKGFELLRIIYIVGKKRYAAHRILLTEGLGLLVYSLHLVLLHALPGRLEHRVQGFRTHAEQLAHLLTKAHPGQLGLDGIGLGGGKDIFFGSALAPGDGQEDQADCQKDERFFHGC